MQTFTDNGQDQNISSATIADGTNYFGINGFAVTVRRVKTDTEHTPSHPHDLTEIEHYHDFCELVIVTHGQSMHHLEGNDFPVTAGDIFLLQGMQRHYFYDRKDLDLINIMYDPEQVGLPENELRKPNPPLRQPSAPETRSAGPRRTTGRRDGT